MSSSTPKELCTVCHKVIKRYGVPDCCDHYTCWPCMFKFCSSYIPGSAQCEARCPVCKKTMTMAVKTKTKVLHGSVAKDELMKVSFPLYGIRLSGLSINVRDRTQFRERLEPLEHLESKVVPKTRIVPPAEELRNLRMSLWELDRLGGEQSVGEVFFPEDGDTPDHSWKRWHSESRLVFGGRQGGALPTFEGPGAVVGASGDASAYPSRVGHGGDGHSQSRFKPIDALRRLFGWKQSPNSSSNVQMELTNFSSKMM